MKQFFDLRTPARQFRFVAVIEAFSWAALLIGMLLKYGFDLPIAVTITGPIHGAFFVLYVLLALRTAVALGWNFKVLALALVGSVPPFASLWFEWWAQRHGHMAELSGVPLGAGPVGEVAQEDSLRLGTPPSSRS